MAVSNTLTSAILLIYFELISVTSCLPRYASDYLVDRHETFPFQYLGIVIEADHNSRKQIPGRDQKDQIRASDSHNRIG
jgi:hypothetical protein